MSKIGSIYISVKADDSEFRKGMTQIRSTAKKAGTDVSQALNSGIKAGTASKNIAAVSTNLKQLAQTAKIPEQQFKTTASAISDGLKDVARQTGLSEKEFQKLNERMLRHQAYKTAENSLRNIARSAGLSGKEIKQMAVQMGYSSKEAKKMAASIDRSTKSTRSMSSAMTGFIRTMLPIMSGALVVRGLQRMSSEFLTTADRVGKLSQATGVAVETLSAYKHAADLSGTSFESTAKGIERLSRNMLDMSQGIGEAKRAFEMLGVQVVDSSGKMKSSDQVMGEIADRFANMEDGAEKTGLAMQIFGRAGADLIPMLNQGSEGIKEMVEEAERLGLTFNKDVSDQAQRVNDQITRLSGSIRGAFYNAMESLLPKLENAVDWMNDWVNENKDFLGQKMPDHIQSLATSVKDIKGVYDSIPEDIKGGAGVVGALLFGKKIALIVAAIQLVPKLANTIRGFQAAFEGKIDWVDFAKMNADELEKALKNTQNMNDIIRGLIDQSARASVGTKELADETKNLGKNTKDTGTAFRETTDDVKHYTDALEKIKTDQANKEAEQWNSVLAIQRQIREEEQQYQSEQIAEAQKIQDEITKDHESQLRERQKDYDRFIGRVEDKTADIFYDMFRDIGNGWDNLLDSMKDIFFRVLAEMAATALAKPLIVPVVSAAAGMLGLPSMAQAATSAATGGYSLPNLNVASGLPGMGWLATTLPGTSTGGAGLGVTAGMGGAGEIGATAGVSLGSALGAGALGALGYPTLGSALGLPQSKVSGLTAGLAGAGGFWGGSALTAGATSGWLAGATAGSVVPVVGTILGALAGGVLGGSLFGDDSTYIEGNTGLTANMFTGEYSGTGPAGDVYAQAIGPYIEQQSALLQAAIAQNVIDSARIESAMGRSVAGRGGIYGAAMDIGPGELATGRVNMAVEDINWQEYVEKILPQDLEKFTARWVQQLGVLMPDLKDAFGELGGITTDLLQTITVVPDGISKIAEYMEEGLTAAEAIGQVQADYQKVSNILSPAIEAALTASATSLDFEDFKEAFSQNILQQVQAAVLQAAQAEMMQSILASSFDAIGGLDKALGSYFAGDISLNELTTGMDDALEKVTAAMDEGAFDKFAEVIRALGVSTEETTENVEDLTGVLQERRSLEMQLLQAEGDIAGLRAMELEEIDESNRWIQERIWQLEDEAIASEEAARAAEEAAQIQERIASERAGLERQILELEGNTAAIRELELAALDESNRALQEHIWALEAEAAAAQEAARIAQERQGLQMEWYQLIGDTASIRAIEIEQIDESNRALQQQIWAKQDEMQAIEDLSRAVETARNNYRNQLTNQIAEAERRQSELEQSFSEAQSKLEQARQQQRQKETDSLNAQLSAQYDALSEAQAMADKWGAIADQLRDYQQSMLVGPESYLMPDQLLAEAQRQFYSGEAEDLPQLASTMLSAARNALTDPAEYRRLFGQVQNEIADQLALAEGKASEAERTANAAEAAIAQLEAQISATEQVETAVIDMDKALREYNEAKRALAQSSYNEQIKYYESELDRLDKMTGEIMSLEEAFDAYQQALTAAIETGYDELIANFGEELSALPQGISDSLYSVNQLGDGAADGYPTSLPVYVEGSTSDETLRTLLEALLIEVREDRELSRKIHRILDRASQGNDYIYTQAAS